MVKQTKNEPKVKNLEKIAIQMTEWIGTTQSLVIHSLFFMAALSLAFFGFNSDQILLLLTTVVSLEAIYLSIFIQMTVNRNTKSLAEVEEDIEDIQEDVEDLEEDIEDIQEEDKKDDLEDRERSVMLKNIEEDLDRLLSDIQTLKKNMPSATTKKYLNG